MNHYTIIHNKRARGKSLSKKYLEDLLNGIDITYELYDVNTKEESMQIIKNSIDNSVEHYCSIGGDGSLNNIVNCLRYYSHPDPVLACLPAGSGSDLIKTFGLPQSIHKAASHLSTDSTYKVDTGRIEYLGNTKYFLNVANIGFLADTVSISERVPNILRKYRYSIGFWLKIVNAKPYDMNIEADNYHFKNRAFNVSVCNGQFIGNGKNISPKSNLQDGLFDIQIFEVNKLEAMKIFFLAKKGLHLREKGVINKLSRSISIESPLPLEVDGDYIGCNKIKIFNEKGTIRFKI